MSNCALCNIPITNENDSKEHILPNAIGGKKTVKGFICCECNSKTGAKWDSVLSNELNDLSLICDIKRDRGIVPPKNLKNTKGETYKYFAGGYTERVAPKIEKKEIGAQTEIYIQAKSKEQLKSVLLGLKRKQYPNIDIEKSIEKFTPVSSYDSAPLHFSVSFGANQSLKSIIKSLLAMVHDAGVLTDICEESRLFLAKGGNAPLGYFYEQDLIDQRPIGIPIHCIYVKGDPEHNRIIGYVEYFGIYRMISILSSSYTGKEFEHIYSINPMSGENIDLTVNLDLTSEKIMESFVPDNVFPDDLLEQFNKVVHYAREKDADNARAQLVEKTMKDTLDSLGLVEGDILEEQHMIAISNNIAEKLAPLLIYQMGGFKEEEYNNEK